MSLCQEGSSRLKAIVVYNFDDVLEQALKAAGVKYHVVHPNKTEEGDGLLIYHPHGYLPLRPEKVERTRKFIFSEEQYHDEYGTPYSRSNLIQLRSLLSNICLFVGMSMNDPNLRRLLDWARTTRTGHRWNYAIKRHSHLHYVEPAASEKWRKEEVEFVDGVFKDMGVKILWVEHFEEIPQILAKIRRNNGCL